MSGRPAYGLSPKVVNAYKGVILLIVILAFRASAVAIYGRISLLGAEMGGKSSIFDGSRLCVVLNDSCPSRMLKKFTF